MTNNYGSGEPGTGRRGPQSCPHQYNKRTLVDYTKALDILRHSSSLTHNQKHTLIDNPPFTRSLSFPLKHILKGTPCPLWAL